MYKEKINKKRPHECKQPLNAELTEEMTRQKIHIEDFESYLDQVIKKAEAVQNTFESPEKNNRQNERLNDNAYVNNITISAHKRPRNFTN